MAQVKPGIMLLLSRTNILMTIKIPRMVGKQVAMMRLGIIQAQVLMMKKPAMMK